MPDSTTTETPYTAAQRAVSEAHDAHQETLKRHEKERAASQKEIDTAVDHLRHLKAGTAPETRLLAEHVIEIDGAQNWEDEDGPKALQEAITDLTKGAPYLRDRYIGTKRYEGWIGQRSDSDYGYGPKHGRIIFRIGLTQEARERLRDGGELTAEEIEAAIQMLTNLPDYVRNGGGQVDHSGDVSL